MTSCDMILVWTNEKRKLSDLVDWERNPRYSMDKDAVRLVNSLDKFGQPHTILIEPDNTLVDGHQRKHAWAAAQKFGPDYEVDVRVSNRKLTGQEREAIVVALHGGASGRWDWNQLAAFDFETLSDWGFDDDLLRQWNDDAANLALMLEVESNDLSVIDAVDEDKSLELSELMALRDKWRVSFGQLWRAGNHWILCGDSTNSAMLEWLFSQSGSPEFLVYDPDWDAGLVVPEYDWRGVIAYADGGRARDVIELFGLPAWVFTWDGQNCWYTPNRPLKRGKLALWFGDIDDYDFNGAHYGDPLEPYQVNNSRGSYKFEPDPRGKHLADVYQQSLPRLHTEGFHPYEKPIDWVRLLIGDCFPGNSVCDLFLGCGNSLLACNAIGKSCVGVDIEPMYIAYLIEQCDKLGLVPGLAGEFG